MLDSRTRLVGLTLLSFLLMLTYSIARPTVESLFLQAHTSAGIPTAWLLVCFGMLLCVAIYNRFVVRVGLLRLFAMTSFISALLFFVLLVARSLRLPAAHYLLYAWKDIYIVILVEIFYSYCNAVYPIKTARWIYGLFGVIGSIGGIAGNLGARWFVRRFGDAHKDTGTIRALWSVPPLLALKGVLCFPLARRVETPVSLQQKPSSPGLGGATHVLRNSSYLVLLLLLIALVQIVVNLVDFSYNTVLESSYPIADARTPIHAGVYALAQTLTILLNSLAGPVLRAVGIPAVLEAVPLLLGGVVGLFMLRSSIKTAIAAKVASKCLDYSLFRIAKESLYIPLSYAEKTLGKSLVDMFMYRVAKALASLLLMAMAGVGVATMTEPVTLLFSAGWLVVTIVIVRRFRRKVSRAEEIQSG